MSKFDEIDSLILNFNLDVLCITEHWLNCTMLPTFLYPGFTTANIFCRTNMSRGGVAILLNNILEFQSLEFLTKLSTESICEISAIAIKKYALVLLVLYRPPNYNNFNQFLEILQHILTLILKKKPGYAIILCGDFNVNLLTEVNHSQKSNLCLLLTSFGLHIIINEVTRPGTLNLGSCVDNVVTSLHYDRISAVVIPTIGSDHNAIVFTAKLDEKSPTLNSYNSSSWSLFRPISDFGQYYFCSLLAKVNWLPLYALSCVDDMFRFFLDVFLDILNTALPLKYFPSRISTRHKWYNDDLRLLKKECMPLFKLYKTHKTIESRQNYLTCKRQYLKEIKLTKQNYHTKLVQEANNKSKVLWTIINNSLGKNNSPPFSSKSLSAESFNNYFINKIDDIIKNIKSCHSDYSTYLHPSINNSKIPIPLGFNFNEVSVDKTYKKILQLNNSNSLDAYGINSIILKLAASYIDEPLTFI